MPWLDISKLEVARTQLETAVDLFFKDADPAPVHTLAHAALEILEVLCGGKSIESFHSAGLNLIREEKRDFVRSKLVEAKNFFKHATSDPAKTLKFNPDASVYVLWDACVLYEKYTGEFTERRNFFLFRCWFAFKHSELFPGLESHFRFLDISGLNLDNKAEFYEAASSAYEIIKRSGQIPYHQ